MGIENGPKFNPTENLESQKVKRPEEVVETTPISPTPEKEIPPKGAESVAHQEQPGGIKKSSEELKQIETIRCQIQETGRRETPSMEEFRVPQNPTETIIRNNRQYTVEYVPKEEIYPAFGYGGGDRAIVRQDLPARVKNFIKEHELYHCRDQATWGGWLGREFRANIVPGLKDPVGLLTTVWATISDFDRIKFYLRRVKERR